MLPSTTNECGGEQQLVPARCLITFTPLYSHHASLSSSPTCPNITYRIATPYISPFSCTHQSSIDEIFIQFELTTRSGTIAYFKHPLAP